MSVQERYSEFVKDQRKFFDELITEDWDTYFSEDWDRARRFEVARLFSRIKPANVLDVGCGCGFHDQAMGGYPFVKRVEAIDYSSRSVEKAEQVYPHPKVHRHVADFFSFKPEVRPDLVVSFAVIEHLDCPREYFQRCAEFLKPGGYAAVLTPNRNRLSNTLRAWKGQPPLLCDPQHYREYTAQDVRALAEPAGFAMAGSFGQGIELGAKLGHNTKLWLGHFLRKYATCIGLIFRRGA